MWTRQDVGADQFANLCGGFGSGIDGGSRQRVSKGDYIMVPEGVPHWFGEIDGALVLMSIHLPHAPK